MKIAQKLQQVLPVLGIAGLLSLPAQLMAADDAPTATRRDTLLTQVDNPDAVLKKLLEGNARFVKGDKKAPDRHDGARQATAVAQRPLAIILSCADSRVAPEVLFDQGIGDLFIVRVAGNTLTPDGLASMEYAVAVLGTPLIFVLGHEGCGAVDAAIGAYEDGATFPGVIDQLVSKLTPAVAIASGKGTPVKLHDAVEQNVEYVVDQAEISGTVLTRAIADKKLTIVGGVYNLSTGEVTLVDGETSGNDDHSGHSH